MCRKIVFSVLLFLVTSAVFAQRQKLVFSPHWLPQAQFAGFYVALDQGFYADAGLDVEIIHPAANVNALRFVLEGKADVVSLFLVTALDAVFEGAPIVNIAQFSQHSAIMFVSMASSGITTLDDFRNKRVGVWLGGFHEVPQALLREKNIEVQWVPILSTVNLFLLGGVDVLTVMWYNEYHQIYLCGVDLEEMNAFFLADYGFNVPEDGLYVLGKTLEERPDELRAFVEATRKGWDYAAANRKYAVQLVVDLMRKENIPSNLAHQQWMLDKVLDRQDISRKHVRPGELHPVDFHQTVTLLEHYRNSFFPVNYHDFFKPVLP